MKFDDIPPEKEATFKQYRAVAYKFASLNEDLVPGTTVHQLARIIQGAMWGYHKAKKKPLTHEEVQNFFDSPVMPDYYIKAIKTKPRLSNEEEKNIEDPKQSLHERLQSKGIKKGAPLASLARKIIDPNDSPPELLRSSLKSRGIEKGESLEDLASKKNSLRDRFDW